MTPLKFSTKVEIRLKVQVKLKSKTRGIATIKLHTKADPLTGDTSMVKSIIEYPYIIYKI